MRKIKWIGMLAAAGLVSAMAGCSWAPPKTRVSGQILGQPFHVTTASDTDIEGLEIQAERQTNGTAKVDVKVSKFTRHMNPDVITATAQRDAAMAQGLTTVLQTAGPILTQMLQQGAAAYTSGGTSLLVNKAVSGAATATTTTGPPEVQTTTPAPAPATSKP